MSEPAADPRDALVLFEQVLAARGLSTKTMTVREGVQSVFDFFRTQRFVSEDGDADDDMLLLQCGTYDWGNGEYYNFILTRQLIFDDDTDHDDTGDDDTDHDGSAIWQLNLTFRFPPTPPHDRLGDSEWCSYSAESADRYEAFVRESEPYRTLADVAPIEVELSYEDAC